MMNQTLFGASLVTLFLSAGLGFGVCYQKYEKTKASKKLIRNDYWSFIGYCWSTLTGVMGICAATPDDCQYGPILFLVCAAIWGFHSLISWPLLWFKHLGLEAESMEERDAFLKPFIAFAILATLMYLYFSDHSSVIIMGVTWGICFIASVFRIYLSIGYVSASKKEDSNSSGNY